jgi:heptose I phosphotransferase
VSRRAEIVGPWQTRLAAVGVGDFARLLEGDGVALGLPGRWLNLVKPGLGGRERWRWDLPDGGTLFVKRYLRTPWREQWDRLWRQTMAHSRAWWEFRQAGALHEQSVPVLRAVAVAEELCGGWECRSVVATEALVGDAVDRSWERWRRAGAPVTRGAARHAFVRRLAQLVSAFHQTGFCHRDLYLCHIFVELADGAAALPRFTLIDLARMHRPRLFRMRWIIKDLAQLDVSARPLGATRADRLRFLLAYLGLAPRAPRVRWYARRIVRKSDRILRRIARRRAAGRTP